MYLEPGMCHEYSHIHGICEAYSIHMYITDSVLCCQVSEHLMSSGSLYRWTVTVTVTQFRSLEYTKHMNIANDPTANIGIQRSNSFSLKTISKESDEMIEAVRRSNSLTSTNSELSFPSRGNSVDYE